MFDLNAALAAWLAGLLKGYSLGLWGIVVSLAGGLQAPLWRWVLVEEGLFVFLLAFGSWWVRMVLGLGNTVRTPEHWGTAAVFASGFSLLWSWYGLVASQAIHLGVHPLYGWEWPFFTWGLPLLAAGSLLPTQGLLPQFGAALVMGALSFLLLGRLWAAARGWR